MWTYLLILFSLVGLVAVFVHRLVVLRRKPVVVEEVVEEEEELPEKRRMSADEKLSVEELCKKGKSHLDYGKDDEAIKCFVQALALNPNHEETAHALAVVYLKKEMFSASAALFKQLAAMTDDPAHYSNLGYVLFLQSDFVEALKAYHYALSLDDSRAGRFASLAQVYREMGRNYHALMAMQKAAALEEESVDFKLVLADLYGRIGDLPKGLAVVEEVLAVKADYEPAKEMKVEFKRRFRQGS